MAKSLKDEILDDLIQDIEDVANTEIDDAFKDEFVDVAYDKWYNTYSDFYNNESMFPIIYERRYTNKGLLDETKMITEVDRTGGNSIQIKFYSEAKTNPYENRQPAYSSLEGGENLVDYLAEEVYPSVRRVDLMQETNNNVENNMRVEKALETGLKRKGYKVI